MQKAEISGHFPHDRIRQKEPQSPVLFHSLVKIDNFSKNMVFSS